MWICLQCINAYCTQLITFPKENVCFDSYLATIFATLTIYVRSENADTGLDQSCQLTTALFKLYPRPKKPHYSRAAQAGIPAKIVLEQLFLCPGHWTMVSTPNVVSGRTRITLQALWIPVPPCVFSDHLSDSSWIVGLSSVTFSETCPILRAKQLDVRAY
jgi:hypothetical protein